MESKRRRINSIWIIVLDYLRFLKKANFSQWLVLTHCLIKSFLYNYLNLKIFLTTIKFIFQYFLKLFILVFIFLLKILTCSFLFHFIFIFIINYYEPSRSSPRQDHFIINFINKMNISISSSFVETTVRSLSCKTQFFWALVAFLVYVSSIFETIC